MAWDIAYKIGEIGGFRSVKTRDDALVFCCDTMLQGGEIQSVASDDKKSTETLSLDQVQEYVAKIRARR